MDKNEIACNAFSPERMIVIDLHSGRYAQERTGHEIFNLERNSIDGKFYGYCPPNDSIDTRKHFSVKSRDDIVDGILVVYVAKKKNSNDREIIAFIPNARIYGRRQPGKKLNRIFSDKEKNDFEVASYSIESDTLVDMRGTANRLEIEIAKYNSYIFRSQRYYGRTYPELDKKIIAYVEDVMASRTDDLEDQEEIQRSDSTTYGDVHSAADRALDIASGSNGRSVVKDGRISKAALERENYICQIGSGHKTFTTARGALYMEGHHLIPCTVENAEHFMNQNGKNIDCLENILCICPTCHRAVHFGDKSTKNKLVKAMYGQHSTRLMEAGIRISEKDLLALYKC